MLLFAPDVQACENSPGGCWRWGVHNLNRDATSIQSEVTVLSGEGSVAFTEEIYSFTEPCPAFGCARAFSESMRHGRAEVGPAASDDIATLVRRSDVDAMCPLINQTRDVVSGPNVTRRNFGFVGVRTVSTTYVKGTGLPDLPVSGPLTAFPLFGNVGTGSDDSCLQVSGTSWHTPTPIPPVEETFRGQSGFSWNPVTGSVTLEDLASQTTIPTTWSTALSIAPQGGFVAGCAATNSLSNFIPGNPPIFNIFPFPTVAPISGPWAQWHTAPGCLTDITVDGGIPTVVGHAGPDAIWGSVPLALTNLGPIDPARQYRVSITPDGDALLPTLDLSTTVHLDGGGSFAYTQRFIDLGLPGFFVNPSAVSDDLGTVGGHDGPDPRMANVSALQVAALGDSYSSGIGAPNDTGPAYTGGACDRSENAYSFFPRPPTSSKALSEIPDDSSDFTFDHVACLGAVTGDIPGQVTAAVTNGVTDFIMLTIGGNDLGFLPIIRHCLSNINCFDDEYQGSGMTLEQRLPALLAIAETNVRTTLIDLQSRASTVLLLGYPDITQGQSCLFGALDSQESRDVSQMIEDLNEVLMRAAREAGAHFRLPTGFNGRGVCAPANMRWVHPPPRMRLLESFHPNANGHRMGYAPVIDQFLRENFNFYSVAGLPLNPVPLP